MIKYKINRYNLDAKSFVLVSLTLVSYLYKVVSFFFYLKMNCFKYNNKYMKSNYLKDLGRGKILKKGIVILDRFQVVTYIFR